MATLSRGLPRDARNPESRLIAEYVAVTFPRDRVMLRVPLGPPIAPADAFPDWIRRLRASRGWRPEVDAVVIRGDNVLLIEAKVNEVLYGMAKLPFYKLLVDDTPELEPWYGLEIRMRLVAPVTAKWVDLLAERTGIEVDLYRPPWIETYLAYRATYWDREHRLAREENRKARERLGL